MKIAFIISRLSEYRLAAPAIDAALRRGWTVECWHNYGRPKSGKKAYLFPDADAAPHFRHGRPAQRRYGSAEELAGWLGRGDVDAVISGGTLDSDAGGVKLPRRPTWICLQGLLDTFVNQSAESLERCDVLATMTPWWTRWAASYYAAVEGSDVERMHARLAARSVHVGFPELDAQGLVDRAELRRRWNIPAGQPVVLLLPFPQGVGRDSFWPKKIFIEPSRMRRLLNVALHRRFRYWREAWGDANDESLVRAARAFCDRHGAFLLVKSRQKTPIPHYTRELADKCVYDESYYPPTILEALSISSLCVSFYSAGVLEAAALSVPNLCITFDAEDYLGTAPAAYPYFERFLTREPGGVFEFEGVSRTVTVEEAIAELRTRSLDDFTTRPAAREAYMRRFIGADDLEAGDRLIDAVAHITCEAPLSR